MVSASRDRAQLILIGAIAVALLVIGISLAVNAVLFTENVRPSESTSQLSEAREIDFETRRSVRSLSARVNHQSRNHTEDEIAVWVGNNVTRLSHLLEESYVASGPMAVNLTYNVSRGLNGSRLVQLGDSTFRSGSDDWTPIGPASGDQRIGWAVVNFNATRSDPQRFHANFSNAQGEEVRMTFNKTTSPVEYEVTTSSTAGSGPRTEVTCTPRRERVLLNLYDGHSYTDDSCVFNGTIEIGNVTSVEFEGSDNVVGRYSFVTNDSSAINVGTDCDDSVLATVPCITPVVWQANVTVGITGEGFQYENRHNVSVYTGGD